MNSIDKLKDITWVKQLGTKSNRHLLDVAGTEGWGWLSPSGLCIAVIIDMTPISQSWLRKVGLLLAASTHSLDDGIVLEKGKAWLIHRYPSSLTPVEQEAALTQQLAVARLLATYGQTTMTTTRPGKMEKE